MKTTTQNKEKNKLIFSIVAVVAIIAIVASSTYAYWTWESSNTEKTNVSVTVNGATMTIVGNNATSTTLRPTNAHCTNGYHLVGEPATFTVVNGTAAPMKATPRLDVKFKTAQGTLTAAALEHIHWAVVEVNSSGTEINGSCASPAYQGTFGKAIVTTVTGGGNTNVVITPSSTPTNANVTNNTVTTIDITKSSSDYTTKLTFPVTAGTANANGTTTSATTTKYYKFYVWIDETYTYKNTGDTVSDPMQNLTITVQWSTKSTLGAP